MDQVTADQLASMSETAHDAVFVHESSTRPPRATVAISLYNYDRFILECLESVRLQTASSLDLIVLDDCSRDGSVETTRNWLSRHYRRFRKCQLLSHQVNQGLAASRNLAFRHAETEYVFVLDADNIVYPRCIEVLAEALDHCDASFAYGYLEKFGAERGIVSYRPWNVRDLETGNYIDAMSMVRKSAWAQVGGYSLDMELGWEDYEFWFKIADDGGWGILVPEFLARYRVHLSSMLRTQTNLQLTVLWDKLERKHPNLKRPSHVSESSYRDFDEVLAHCDRVRCVSDSSSRCWLHVHGWALARCGVASLHLFVDDRPVGQARYGHFRPDIGERTAGYPNGIQCGFTFQMKLPDGIENGEHFLMIRATSTSGKVLELHEVFRVVHCSAEESVDSESGCVEHRLLA